MPSTALLTFYGALVGAASVFLGLLTALLIADLDNIESDRDRIGRRIERNGNRRQELESRKTSHEQEKARIEGKWDREDRATAQENIDKFIDRDVGSEFFSPIETVTEEEIEEAFANYQDYDSAANLSRIEREELRDRRDAIERVLLVDSVDYYRDEVEESGSVPALDKFIERYRRSIEADELRDETVAMLEKRYTALEKKMSRQGMFSGLDIGPINPMMAPVPSIEASATAAQISANRRIKEEEEHAAHERALIDVRAELTRIEEEDTQLEDERNSLGGGQIKKTLRETIIAILLSVLIPAIALFLEATGLQFAVPQHLATLYVVGVFGSWVGGLGYVLSQFRDRINSVGS